MEAWASSLIVGTLLAVSLTWLVSLINARNIKRETEKIDSASGLKERRTFGYKIFMVFQETHLIPSPIPA